MSDRLVRRFAGFVYRQIMAVAGAYAPKLTAKVAYKKTYGRFPDMHNPRTFSEKLLWLRFHTYNGNRQILKLCDKYEVREYVCQRGVGDTLNELFFLWDDPVEIDWDSLPDQFALKLSQGWASNILCRDKRSLDVAQCRREVRRWMHGRRLYDRNAAAIGGIKPSELKKHIICERYLGGIDGAAPADYKIYCFHGEPKAILYIADRYGPKKGCFMSVDWRFISDVDASYEKMEEAPRKPQSLGRMLSAAKALSEPFPFVRVDFYDFAGKAIFGEMTFFPSGCVGMQETSVDGVEMADMLRLSIDGGKNMGGHI